MEKKIEHAEKKMSSLLKQLAGCASLLVRLNGTFNDVDSSTFKIAFKLILEISELNGYLEALKEPDSAKPDSMGE